MPSLFTKRTAGATLLLLTLVGAAGMSLTAQPITGPLLTMAIMDVLACLTLLHFIFAHVTGIDACCNACNGPWEGTTACLSLFGVMNGVFTGWAWTNAPALAAPSYYSALAAQALPSTILMGSFCAVCLGCVGTSSESDEQQPPAVSVRA